MKPDSTAAFERNPVLMAFHRYDALPLGKVMDLEKSKKGLKFTARFAKTTAASEAFETILDLDGMASFSVGFIPKSSRDMSIKEVAELGVDTSGARGDRIRVYDHCELLEISLAPVPSCPMATALGAAYMDGKIKSIDLNKALAPWKGEIDLATLKDEDLGKMVSRTLDRLDLHGLMEKSRVEAVARLREELREQKNEPLRRSIVDGVTESLVAEAHAKKLATERARKRAGRKPVTDVDLEDPKSVREYVEYVLGDMDFAAIAEERIQLAIDKMRGKVY